MNRLQQDAFPALLADRICAFYFKKNDTSSFLVGQIIQADLSGNVLLHLLNPEGQPDGFLSCSFSAFYRIECNSIYLQPFLSIEMQQSPALRATCWETLLEYATKNQAPIQLLNANGKNLITNGVALNFSEHAVSVQNILRNGVAGSIRKYQQKTIGFLFCGAATNITQVQSFQEEKHGERIDNL